MSRRISRISKFITSGPKPISAITGGGVRIANGCACAMSRKIASTLRLSLVNGTATGTIKRPDMLKRVQFVTRPEIRSEFGTITSDLSKVWMRVDRTEIDLTMPCVVPTSIQSPSLTGRSISRMMPDTKFDTTACKPKPMPTDNAPATMARPERSIPAALIPTSAARKMPT
ncbi:MAG: hypothetical protein ACD_54C00865G0001 [uncultured bacterium]|nr:MAG: hypothetical protein ACD_54C00865G0001 [uncultured bacterium]